MFEQATGKVSRVVVAWTAGTATIKAAVTGKRIRLLGGLLIAGTSASTVKFITSGTGDTDLTGVMTPANSSPVLDRIDPAGYCETVAAEALKAVVTGTFNGVLLIQEID